MFIYGCACKLSLVVVSGFLIVAASLVVELGLLSTGSVVAAPGLGALHPVRSSWSGMEPTCPAWAGGFLTTGTTREVPSIV